MVDFDKSVSIAVEDNMTRDCGVQGSEEKSAKVTPAKAESHLPVSGSHSSGGNLLDVVVLSSLL